MRKRGLSQANDQRESLFRNHQTRPRVVLACEEVSKIVWMRHAMEPRALGRANDKVGGST
jgi:hypothetical protein